MKQYLDIEMGPIRNIQDALRSDLEETSFNQMPHKTIHKNDPDVWSILYEKLINSKQTKY